MLTLILYIYIYIKSYNNSYYGQGPQLNSLRKLKVSLEPTGSWLPLAQNSPKTKVAHLGGGCSEPFHYLGKLLG